MLAVAGECPVRELVHFQQICGAFHHVSEVVNFEKLSATMNFNVFP
jgi:hypothetical protein